jgi:hypothetical protein
MHLYNGFQFSADIGQVVPKEIAADLRFVGVKDEGHVEPLGQAKLYLVTKHLPGVEPAKGTKVTVGSGPFSAKYFEGTFQLKDDGRRGGVLTLRVDNEGMVTGDYVSDSTGGKYPVSGKTAVTPKHQIEFVVAFPQTKQIFTGWMFTKDAKVICGFTKIQDREFGFYAERVAE